MTIEKHPQQSDADFQLMLQDYRLTMAEILYHLPDHPALLQSYVWQELDIAPRFPVLGGFLEFWQRELDGKIHSVTVDHTQLIAPTDWRFGTGELQIH